MLPLGEFDPGGVSALALLWTAWEFLRLSFHPVQRTGEGWGMVSMLITVLILLAGAGPALYKIYSIFAPNPPPGASTEWPIVGAYTMGFLVFFFLFAGMRLQSRFYSHFKLEAVPMLKPGGGGSRWIWLKVSNASKGKELRRYQASLQTVEVIAADAAVARLPNNVMLPWSKENLRYPSDIYELDIRRGKFAYLDVAMLIQADGEHLRIPREPIHGSLRPDYNEFVLPRGQYLFHVQVSSGGERTECEADIWLKIDFRGNFEADVEHIPLKAIRELNKLRFAQR